MSKIPCFVLVKEKSLKRVTKIYLLYDDVVMIGVKYVI